MELAALWTSFCTGAACAGSDSTGSDCAGSDSTGAEGFAVAICTGSVSRSRLGDGTGRAVSALAASATGTTAGSGAAGAAIATMLPGELTLAITVTCDAFTGSVSAALDVASRLGTGAASVFATSDESRPPSPATAQPVRTTVAHIPANIANRRGLIIPPPPGPTRVMLHSKARDSDDVSNQDMVRQ